MRYTTVKKRGNPEHHLQAWFDIWATEKGLLHNASVSAVRVSLFVARKMKEAGYKKGFPDFQICEPRGKYHGLFIEMKVEHYPTPEQKWWQVALTQRGYKAIIVPGKLDYHQAQVWLVEQTEAYLRGEA